MKTDVTEREPSGRPSRSYWFCTILYPDCPEHMLILDVMKENPALYQHLMFILHDRDLYSEDTEDHKVGEVKKAHYHCLWRHPRPTTENAVIKEFGGYLNKVIGVSSPEATLLYFLHRNFLSRMQHKVEYSVEEIQGDLPEVTKLVGHNDNFVQLGDLTSMICGSKYGMMSELMSQIQQMDERTASSYLDTIKTYQSIICTMSNQAQRWKELHREKEDNIDKIN